MKHYRNGHAGHLPGQGPVQLQLLFLLFLRAFQLDSQRLHLSQGQHLQVPVQQQLQFYPDSLHLPENADQKCLLLYYTFLEENEPELKPPDKMNSIPLSKINSMFKRDELLFF